MHASCLHQAVRSFVVVLTMALSFAAATPASATPILPSPLAIELVDPVRHADPGDALTFSGVLRNLTADTLWFEGWGWNRRITPKTSETLLVSACNPAYPEFCAWPKNPALGPFEATTLMALIKTAVPPSLESGQLMGDIAIAAYPVGVPFRNPDGSLIWDFAYGIYTINVGEPPFPAPIPEPATFVLTTVGGLLMYRTRCRRACSVSS